MFDDFLTFSQDRPGLYLRRLRWLFLLPVTLLLLLIAGLLVTLAYGHAAADIDNRVAAVKDAVLKIYRSDIKHHTETLAGIIEALTRDATIARALARGDRAQLLALSKPLYQDLASHYDVSHFYYIAPDHSVILRLHYPEKYGDHIDRLSLRNAERSGKTAAGVELGVLGTLTLRVVVPLYDDARQHQLLGFMELGVDTNHILDDIQMSLGVQLFEFLRKDLLTRASWEQGTAASGLRWDDFTRLVPTPLSLQRQTPPLMTLLRSGAYPETAAGVAFTSGAATYRAVTLPLHDISQQTVGDTLILVDTTDETEGKHMALRLSLVLGCGGGIGIFILFWILTGKINRLIAEQQMQLRRLASRDDLTGLYNRRIFHAFLDEEIARARRYGRKLSLLMVDVDHFKRVNDEFGHQAGDAVLKQIATAIAAEVRDAVDRVCRYGGEEFAIILPETDLPNALMIAERLRAKTADLVIKLHGDTQTRMTVSVGVATNRGNDEMANLIQAADRALYEAKQGGRNRVQASGGGD